MFSDSNQESHSILKNPLFYTATFAGIAVLAVAWIMFFRWYENREIERRAAQQHAEQQREQDLRSMRQFGGKDLEIMNFYASPGVIRRGESTQLCYGVANVKTIRIDPPPAVSIWPSYARCIDVSPKKDTTYTLTIQDASGNIKTSAVEVKVR
jgi:hypothetical protein